jgi:hypothetical protein
VSDKPLHRAKMAERGQPPCLPAGDAAMREIRNIPQTGLPPALPPGPTGMFDLSRLGRGNAGPPPQAPAAQPSTSASKFPRDQFILLPVPAGAIDQKTGKPPVPRARCTHCPTEMSSSNVTDMKKHLLDGTKCKYLWSDHAEQSPYQEVRKRRGYTGNWHCRRV